jgi:ParB-like chromosome segregation protein Spo0J
VTTTTVPLARLRYDREVWPRVELNQERVALFAGLFRDGEELPAIEVVALDDGTYLIADGVHRGHAARRVGKEQIEAILVTPDPGEDPSACTFRRALETATRSALPLTSAERRLAVWRLLAVESDKSHRAIARLVGVSHNSVDRWARELDDSSTCGDPRGAVPRSSPGAEQVARRLVNNLVALDAARGLSDLVVPSRMGRHLATAFEARLGDDALAQAQRFAEWTAAAVSVLEQRRK